MMKLLTFLLYYINSIQLGIERRICIKMLFLFTKDCLIFFHLGLKSNESNHDANQ